MIIEEGHSKKRGGVKKLKLSEVEIGRKVVYTPFKGCGEDQKEEGIITSKNDKYIFVQYGSDTHSKATNVKDLEYL